MTVGMNRASIAKAIMQEMTEATSQEIQSVVEQLANAVARAIEKNNDEITLKLRVLGLIV